MNNLKDQISDNINKAMRDKDKLSLNTLRALKTAMTNAAIEKSGSGAELEEAEIISIIRKQIKQRQDSILHFEKANRTELADNEKEEIKILEQYLPAQLSDEEIAKAVSDAIAETGASSKKDMGQVMKLLQEKTQGQADGKKLSQEVMKHLS